MWFILTSVEVLLPFSGTQFCYYIVNQFYEKKPKTRCSKVLKTMGR